jgi:hypothetical protein
MALMTEVFAAWASEGLEKQPVQFAQPFAQPHPYGQQNPYPQQQPYLPQQPYAQQPYPQAQPWQQAQQPQYQQQVQAAYNYNSPSQYPAHLAGHPTPLQSPAPSYTSPVAQPATPHTPYGYGPPQGGAVEMLAELPGETLLAAPAPVLVRSVSTEVSSSSLALLARDLWGADSTLEEEKVTV